MIELTDATIKKLEGDFKMDSKYISSLYVEEEKPIFEFSSYHIVSYLSYNHQVYTIVSDEFMGILVSNEDNTLHLFTPRIFNLEKFSVWLKNNPQITRILNVSSIWVEKYYKQIGGKLNPRSQNEAVYDVDLLTELTRKEFRRLRNTKRRLLESNLLTFKPVNDENITDAYQVLQKWQEVQGHKYEKNKFEKEKFVYSKFLEMSAKTKDLIFEIGYINEVPLCVCGMHNVEWLSEWAVIYFVKGINRSIDGGIHGISDATYLHLFDIAKKRNIRFLNDGELGTEEGTRSHKLRFKPIMFLKSYDILLV